jgi:hypothetical protein
MSVNRRSFFQCVGIVVAAPLVPELAAREAHQTQIRMQRPDAFVCLYDAHGAEFARGDWYRRMPVVFEKTVTDGTITLSNSNSIRYPTATRHLGTVQRMKLVDPAGVEIATSWFTCAKTINTGDSFCFAERSIQMRMDAQAVGIARYLQSHLKHTF